MICHIVTYQEGVITSRNEWHLNGGSTQQFKHRKSKGILSESLDDVFVFVCMWKRIRARTRTVSGCKVVQSGLNIDQNVIFRGAMVAGIHLRKPLIDHQQMLD